MSNFGNIIAYRIIYKVKYFKNDVSKFQVWICGMSNVKVQMKRCLMFNLLYYSAEIICSFLSGISCHLSYTLSFITTIQNAQLNTPQTQTYKMYNSQLPPNHNLPRHPPCPPNTPRINLPSYHIRTPEQQRIHHAARQHNPTSILNSWLSPCPPQNSLTQIPTQRIQERPMTYVQ